MGKNDSEDVTMSEGTDALSLSGNSGTFGAYQISRVFYMYFNVSLLFIFFSRMVIGSSDLIFAT